MADTKARGSMSSGDETVNTKADDSAAGVAASRRPTIQQSTTLPELGKAEELGQEDAGDIADEGRGHRG